MRLHKEVDECVSIKCPELLQLVGLWELAATDLQRQLEDAFRDVVVVLHTAWNQQGSTNRK